MLDVYLCGEHVGTLSRRRRRRGRRRRGYEFAYSESALEAGEQARLSRSLPLRAKPYAHKEVRPFVEGLLPSGKRRELIAAELDLDPADGFGLIAELGRDCPGAVVFLPEGSPPPERTDPDSLQWMATGELEEVLQTPPQRHLDPERPERMRFALPGERHKLALILDQERGWAWPDAGTPSTHILYPEPEQLPGFALNEVACLNALREMGLSTPLAQFAPDLCGRPCVVSARFDRWGAGAEAERLHQESFCQALGVAPDSKPDEVLATARSCELLAEIGEEDAVESLFKALFSAYLVGSGEPMHGQNTALLYPGGRPLLAPFYDISSDRVYERNPVSPNFYQWVLRNAPLAGLAQAALPCRYDIPEAVELGIQTGTDLRRNLCAVADSAEAVGWGSEPIEQIADLVLDRLKELSNELVELVRQMDDGDLPDLPDLPDL